MFDVKSNQSGSAASRLMASTAMLVAMAAGILAAAPEALALPAGGTVAAGSATITNGSTSTTINQSTSKAVINWNSYDVSSGTSVTYNQPNSQAITLNVIGGTAPAYINGQVTGNGQLWFIDSAGFVMGKTGNINSAGALLSTSGIQNATGSGFYTNPSGYYMFSTPSGGTPATITLNGSTLTGYSPTTNGGYVVLQGQGIAVNNSNLHAPGTGGSVALGVGTGATVDFSGDSLINYSVDGFVSQKIAGLTSSLTVNKSNVQSGQGGWVSIQALVDKDAVLDHVINLGGAYYDTNGDYNGTNVGNNTFSSTPNVYVWTE
jgi:filamentous hemagglutinin family protein